MPPWRGGRLGPFVGNQAASHSNATQTMRVVKSRQNNAELPFCHGFDFPFACVSAVAFTLGFLSLYLCLSLKGIIPL
jgi:hypothetical protein